MRPGRVYLVGAGPGDPGLITQKGLECLKQAEVVVFDRLLDESLLEVCASSVEKIYAGKASSEHTLPQVEINRLLVKKAREGKTVVRLKGGDPFVFGRGGEEAEALVQNSIPFEVVPGITSAISAPAYAGIPVTHRGIASSFAVITGHEDPAKIESSINWPGLATSADTLIFLMGLQNLAQIVDRLIHNGLSRETPVAVIKAGTRPQQRVVQGILRDIVKKVEENGLSSPAVIVVGQVVKLRQKLSWFDNRPLFGKRILVTRARDQAGTLSKLLSARGAQAVELPAIVIHKNAENLELRQVIGDLAGFHWLIFTSVNEVEAFFETLHSMKLDSRALNGLNIGAIGPATGGALEKQGIQADFQPQVYTSEGIIAGLSKLEMAGKRVLLPRADIADDSLLRGIRQLQAKAVEVAAYRTTPATESILQTREKLKSQQIDIVTFASSSTVSNLMDALGEARESLRGVIVASIGPKTSETARKAGLRVDIEARQQTITGLVAAIEEFFARGE